MSACAPAGRSTSSPQRFRYSGETLHVEVQAATAAGYKDIYKKTLIGIGEMEKLMGKEQFRSILGQYVTKPHGKLTLVPESDRREAVTASTAQDDFTEV